MRRFWIGYAVLVTAYLLGTLGLYAGPAVEATLAPIRVDQAIAGVTRAGPRLCFGWRSIKLRDGTTDDLDVYVHSPRHPHRFTASLFREADGMPWSSAGAVPVGPVDRRYCLTLPPNVETRDDARVEVTVWYPGWLGLWRVPLRLPPIVSAGRS